MINICWVIQVSPTRKYLYYHSHSNGQLSHILTNNVNLRIWMILFDRYMCVYYNTMLCHASLYVWGFSELCGIKKLSYYMPILETNYTNLRVTLLGLYITRKWPRASKILIIVFSLCIAKSQKWRTKDNPYIFRRHIAPPSP